VHEQQGHEAERELPAPEQGVGADRDDHRERGRYDLELEDREEDELELREQRTDHDERGGELPQEAEARLWPDRPELVGLVRLVRLARGGFRGDLAHELIVAL
jgi:hypothetical protein